MEKRSVLSLFSTSCGSEYLYTANSAAYSCILFATINDSCERGVSYGRMSVIGPSVQRSVEKSTNTQGRSRVPAATLLFQIRFSWIQFGRPRAARLRSRLCHMSSFDSSRRCRRVALQSSHSGKWASNRAFNTKHFENRLHGLGVGGSVISRVPGQSAAVISSISPCESCFVSRRNLSLSPMIMYDSFRIR
jgi:hypothetical protein